jgi:hypothetical protein
MSKDKFTPPDNYWLAFLGDDVPFWVAHTACKARKLSSVRNQGGFQIIEQIMNIGRCCVVDLEQWAGFSDAVFCWFSYCRGTKLRRVVWSIALKVQVQSKERGQFHRHNYTFFLAVPELYAVKCNVSPFGRNYGKPQPSGLINNTYVTTL